MKKETKIVIASASIASIVTGGVLFVRHLIKNYHKKLQICQDTYYDAQRLEYKDIESVDIEDLHKKLIEGFKNSKYVTVDINEDSDDMEGTIKLNLKGYNAEYNFVIKNNNQLELDETNRYSGKTKNKYGVRKD